jgi:4-amino-4-deoxy-L-arabinose transferase-like glycosyltransferase
LSARRLNVNCAGKRARLAAVRPWPAVLCILALALALRLAFVLATPEYTPRHDDRSYDRLACSIVLVGHYPVRPADADRESCGAMPAGANAPTAFRPPGWPMVLAGIHVVGDPLPVERWTRARVANALLGTLSVALIGLIAVRVWNRRVALVAMAVLALDLHLILVGGSLMSETLFVALVLGAVLAALESRTARRAILWAAGAGVLIGLAALTRPTALVLALPLGLAVAKRSPRQPAAAIVLVAATALTIAPWTVRNAVQMHAFIPVSDFTGSWLAGTYNDQARADPHHPGSSQTFVAGEFDDLDGVPEVERQRELTRRGLEYAADHPGYVAQVLFFNTRRLLNLEGSRWWRRQGWTMSLPRWAADAAAYAFFALALLALAGAFTRAARRAPAWLWLVPILLFASVIFAGSALRYRAPVEPFLALLAALALTARADRTLRTFPGSQNAPVRWRALPRRRGSL